MSSKDTQSRIKDAAISLFNERGSSNVSTNLIAEQSDLSRGNLYYHYKCKKELIQAIYEDVVTEIDHGWYGDEKHPTVNHMAEMFARQIDLTWRYRFLYRESVSLTREDPILAERMREMRERRIDAIVVFFQQLVEADVMMKPRSNRSLRYLVIMTWIFSENWLNFKELQDSDEDEDLAQTGYDFIIEMLYPYLTERARQKIVGSYNALQRYRDQQQDMMEDVLSIGSAADRTANSIGLAPCGAPFLCWP